MYVADLATASCLLSSVLVTLATSKPFDQSANRKYDSEVTNRCPQPSEEVPIPNAHYYTHPRDCRKFVSCSYGLPHVLSCPDKTLFNDEVVSCVHEDSPLSRGIQCPEKGEIITDGTCGEENKNSLIPNEKACQRYYNCSDTSSRYYSFLEPFEQECTYPDLFDSVDLMCVPWNEARCASGAVIGVNPCDYVQNQCVAAHCEPCYSRIPSCEGKQDGFNEHPSKLWTPHYVRCESNRSMEAYWCPNDPANTPFRMIFSPVAKSCVTVWEVPQEFRGFQPSCDKKEESVYHVTAESDRVYYKCPGAQVYFCEEGQMFSVEIQACIMSEPASTTVAMVTEEPEMTSTVAIEQPETTEDRNNTPGSD